MLNAGNILINETNINGSIHNDFNEVIKLILSHHVLLNYDKEGRNTNEINNGKSQFRSGYFFPEPYHFRKSMGRIFRYVLRSGPVSCWCIPDCKRVHPARKRADELADGIRNDSGWRLLL